MGTLSKFKPVPVEVEINGDKMFLISMNGARRAMYRDKLKDGVGAEFVVALTLCDAEGKLEYDCNNEDHIKELKEVDGSVLDKIAMKAFEVSGLTDKASSDAEKK